MEDERRCDRCGWFTIPPHPAECPKCATFERFRVEFLARASYLMSNLSADAGTDCPAFKERPHA